MFTSHFTNTQTHENTSRHIPQHSRGGEGVGAGSIFAFQPNKMHMKGEEAVCSAASSETQLIIAAQRLSRLSELHTCGKHGRRSTTGAVLSHYIQYTRGRKWSRRFSRVHITAGRDQFHINGKNFITLTGIFISSTVFLRCLYDVTFSWNLQFGWKSWSYCVLNVLPIPNHCFSSIQPFHFSISTLSE